MLPRMLNIFALGKQSKSHAHDEHGHDHNHDEHGHSDHHDISVHHRSAHDEEYDPSDVGQIALDIGDTDEAIIILAPIAGVPSETIDISIAKNILTISGVRRRPESTKAFEQVLVEECFWGAFSRSIVLPENLSVDKIVATMDHNLLEITIPRIAFPARSVKISTAVNMQTPATKATSHHAAH